MCHWSQGRGIFLCFIRVTHKMWQNSFTFSRQMFSQNGQVFGKLSRCRSNFWTVFFFWKWFVQYSSLSFFFFWHATLNHYAGPMWRPCCHIEEVSFINWPEVKPTLSTIHFNIIHVTVVTVGFLSISQLEVGSHGSLWSLLFWPLLPILCLVEILTRYSSNPVIVSTTINNNW